MGFVQIIEYETERADEVNALMRQSAEQGTATGFSRLTYVHDRDQANRYLVIVEFNSYDEAMANSAKPETAQMAASLAALCSSGPRFHNLDVLATMP